VRAAGRAAAHHREDFGNELVGGEDVADRGHIRVLLDELLSAALENLAKNGRNRVAQDLGHAFEVAVAANLWALG